MKKLNKFISIIIALSLLCLSGCSESKSDKKVYNDKYNPQKAVAYSYKYAKERNPEYANFEANCTNYISQILVAGGKQMDTPNPPEKDTRIIYDDDTTKWYSTYIETNPERWKEFSVSTAFCRTDDFVEYWTKTRGMKLTKYVNSFDGLIKLYSKAKVGDIIVLYSADDDIIHLCFLAVKENKKLLVNANTNDYKDRNILNIPSESYPKIGLLQMK